MPNKPDALESLRTFALSNSEIRFSHMVTAALNGEGWAVERVERVLALIAEGDAANGPDDQSKLRIIRAADTTPPGAARPRSLDIDI